MAVTVNMNRNSTAVVNIVLSCDTCKYDWESSGIFDIGRALKYTPPEERKASKAALARTTKGPHVPKAAVPVEASLRTAIGNAAAR